MKKGFRIKMIDNMQLTYDSRLPKNHVFTTEKNAGHLIRISKSHITLHNALEDLLDELCPGCGGKNQRSVYAETWLELGDARDAIAYAHGQCCLCGDMANTEYCPDCGETFCNRCFNDDGQCCPCKMDPEGLRLEK